MTDQHSFDRSLFVARIFGRLGGMMFIPPDEDEILPLGNAYKSVMTKLYARRTKIFSDIKQHLAVLSDEALQLSFSADGTAVSEEAKAWASARRHQINQAFDRLSPWYLAPLFRTKDLADFDHWSRSAFLTLDEAVWLSVGLEPTKHFTGAIERFTTLGNTKEPDGVSRYMGRHKEQLRRQFDPFNYEKSLQAAPLLEWTERVNFPVHTKFVEALRIMELGSQGATTPKTTLDENTPAKMDHRERVSLAKMITAMAIDGYGYEPTSTRSPIPNEIVALTDRLGLSVSKDTVRKYLKLGAEHLPRGWNDD